MGRRKKKKKTQRKGLSSSEAIKLPRLALRAISNWPKKLFAFLAASGLLVVLLTGVYRYVSGHVTLEYIGTTGRGYEFQLKNETPADKVVVNLRIVPRTPQSAAVRMTKSIRVERDEAGHAILPDGGSWHVPAADFKDLDGHQIPADSTIKFRIPPLVDHDWLAPAALSVSVSYSTRPTSSVLRWIEDGLGRFDGKRSHQESRFVVIDDYWMDVGSQQGIEAMTLYCRENDSNGSQEMCRTIVRR